MIDRSCIDIHSLPNALSHSNMTPTLPLSHSPHASPSPKMSLSKTNILELQFSLRQAVIDCSERCQYQSAKWAAELLDALPDDDLGEELIFVNDVSNIQTDPVEMRLERNELPKYLMAKALLDCHELRRCAAVYLSSNPFEHTIPLHNNVINTTGGKLPGTVLSKISQKSLFLASARSPPCRRKSEERRTRPHPRTLRYWRNHQQGAGAPEAFVRDLV